MFGAHVICVDEASACQVSAAVRECVEANLTDHELVKPAAHSRVRCESGRESCHSRLVPLSGVSQDCASTLEKYGSLNMGDCQSCFSSIYADAGFHITSPNQQEFCATPAQRHGGSGLESSTFRPGVDQSVSETSQSRLPIAQDAAAPLFRVWSTFSERGCISRSTGWARHQQAVSSLFETSG